MHAANVAKSERLQRVDRLLSDGREYSTRDIAAYTGCLAVNSAIAELRQQGRNIVCRQRQRTWYYRVAA